MEIIRIRVTLDGEKTALSALTKIDNEIDKINKKKVNVNVNTKATDEMAKSTGEAAKQARLLGDTLSMIKFAAIAAAIGGVTSAFRSALTEMKAVDTQLTNIQKVSGATATEINRIGDAAYATASKYGVAANEYLSAVYTFQKAGLGDSAEKLGELATKTMLVGDTTADVASKFLIAINAAWNLEGSFTSLSTVVDQADYINNNYATSLDKLAAAMPIVASTSANLGMSIEETMAVIGTITAKTQETGTKAATAWRALAMNITGQLGTIYDETGEAIEVTEESVKSIADAMRIYGNEAVQAAQQSGKIIDPMEAVISLAEAYKDGLLNDIDLTNILMSVGGKLRTNQLTALVKDLASETSTYYDIMSKLPQAAGTADSEIGIMLSSWESKTNILKNTWTEFVQKSLSSDSIKGLLDGLTKILDFMDNLGSAATLLGSVMLAAFSGKIASGIVGIGTSVKNLTTLLSGAAASAGVLQLSLMGLGTVFSILTLINMGIQEHREQIVETASAASEAAAQRAEQLKSQSDGLEDLIAQYDELAKEGVTDENRAQIKKIEEEINSLLGEQKTAVDLVNGSYTGQKEILDGILADVKEQTEGQLILARQEAATALAGVPAAMKVDWVFSSDLAEDMREKVFGNLSSFQIGDGDYWGAFLKVDTGSTAESVSAAYDEITTAIQRMSEAYTDAELEHNGTWQWLHELEAGLRDSVKAYDDAADAVDDFNKKSFKDYIDNIDKLNNEEGNWPIAEAFEEVGEAAETAADDIDAAVNRVSEAKSRLDELLAAGSETDGFDDMADAVERFRQMIDSGEVNSHAFWNTAEFLFGPDVVAQYYNNADGLIALFQNSSLEELFLDAQGAAQEAGAGLDALFMQMLALADESGIVADGVASIGTNADGSMNIAIDSVSGLAEALNVPEDALWTLIDTWSQFSSLKFSDEDLLAYLNHLGVEFETVNKNGKEVQKISFTSLVQQLNQAGWAAPEIAEVVTQLSDMGSVDMEGLEDGLDGVYKVTGKIKTGAKEAEDAVDDLDDKKTSNAQRQLGFLQALANSAKGAVNQAADAMDELDGKTATTYIDVVTRHKQENEQAQAGRGQLYDGPTAAYGTNNASGGPTLVGEEYSPDGSPRPELIYDKGRTYLAGQNGPEIVRLSAGAKVFPYSETKRILSGEIPAYASGNISYTTPGNYGVTGTYKPKTPTTTTPTTGNKPTTTTGNNPSTPTTETEEQKKKRLDELMKTMDDVLGDMEHKIWLGLKNGTMTREQAIAEYRLAMRRVLNYQSRFKSEGLDENDDYIQKLDNYYWKYSDEIIDLTEESEKKQQERYDSYVDKLDADLEDRDFAVEKGLQEGTMSVADEVKSYKGSIKKINKIIEKLKSLGLDENDDRIQDLMREAWSYQEKIDKAVEDETDRQDTKRSDLTNEAKSIIEKRIQDAAKERDARIKAIQDEVNAAEDLNSLEEKRLALMEAQEALQNAQAQRNVRIYNAETGQWEWVANAEAVKTAKKNAEDAKKAYDDEQARQEREARIAAINKEYDDMEAAWQRALETLEEPVRSLRSVINELRVAGTQKEQNFIGEIMNLPENITEGLLVKAIGNVIKKNKTGIIGTTPVNNGSPTVLTGGTVGKNNGPSYYINGVEISAEKAQTMTIAALARELSTLSIYTN